MLSFRLSRNAVCCQISRMEVKTLYDLLAPIYGRVMPSMSPRITARAVERIKAGAPDSVLEVGMGPGQLVRELEKKISGRVVGVDISKRMVAHATRQPTHTANRARFARADGLYLPFRRGEFESIVSVFLFDVLDDEAIPKMLEEMGRVLAPGGRIVVATLHITNSLIKTGWSFTYRVMPDLVGKARPASINQYIEELGFRVLIEEEIDEFAGARILTLVKVVG